MLSNVYTIYDRVAEEGCPVFQARNHGVALRHFKQLMSRDDIPFHDYRLYCLGSFDDCRLVFTPLSAAEEVFSPSSGDLVDGAPVGAGG